MRRAAPIVVAILVAATLQVALAPHMAIAGVVPNVLLLVVLTLALTQGPVAGTAAGFAAGLTLDMLGTSVIGAYALVLAVVGYAVGLFHSQIFAEGWLLPVTAVFVGGLAAEFLYGLVLAVLGAGGPFWTALVRVMLPGAVYNTALALLVYPWLARFLRRERPMTTFRRLA